MNIKKIQEKSIEYIKKNSEAIYSNLNVFEPVSKGYEQGYMDCLEDSEKGVAELKKVIKELVDNAPDTYSGTNIELQQKKMFAFQNAVNKAEFLLEEKK